MIFEFLRDDHRACDRLFAAAEEAVAKGDLTAAQKQFPDFMKRTLQHFDMEEQVLFPAFEARTGMREGPTQVMRMEHEHVRKLLERLKHALEQSDQQAFFGITESMMILLQQHNMKEEQMLYRMCDQTLQGDAALVVDEMKAL